MKLSDEVQAEVEALEYTYPKETYDIAYDNDNNTLVLTASIRPRDDPEMVFCAFNLVLATSAEYPNVTPDVKIQEVKGLSDNKQHLLLSVLKQEAESLQGSLMLGHLIETSISWASDNNTPEGSCAFCLEPLTSNNTTTTNNNNNNTSSSTTARNAAAQACVALPCYHAFHIACYSDWWVWQQTSCGGQERELVQHTGARAAATVLGDKLPPREAPPHDHLYATTCPVCRAPAPLAQLPHISDQLEQALNNQLDNYSTAATTSTSTIASVGVDMQRVRAMQKQHQQVWRKQEQAGGLVGAPTSYSITSMSRLASGGGEGSQGVAALSGGGSEVVGAGRDVSGGQMADQGEQTVSVLRGAQSAGEGMQGKGQAGLTGRGMGRHHGRGKPGGRGPGDRSTGGVSVGGRQGGGGQGSRTGQSRHRGQQTMVKTQETGEA